MKVRVSKAAWIWLIIPVINIPLGVGVYIFVKAQMTNMSVAAERKQAELIARAEQAERERAEAEARANQEDDKAEEEPPAPPPIRPPLNPGGQAPTGPISPSEPESPEEPLELLVMATCNGGSCDDLTGQTEGVIVRISSNEEIEVPSGWTRLDENTIRRRFAPPDDEQDPQPLEVKITSQDGRTKKVTLRLDLWFNNAYDNSN